MAVWESYCRLIFFAEHQADSCVGELFSVDWLCWTQSCGCVGNLLPIGWLIVLDSSLRLGRKCDYWLIDWLCTTFTRGWVQRVRYRFGIDWDAPLAWLIVYLIDWLLRTRAWGWVEGVVMVHTPSLAAPPSSQSPPHSQRSTPSSRCLLYTITNLCYYTYNFSWFSYIFGYWRSALVWVAHSITWILEHLSSCWNSLKIQILRKQFARWKNCQTFKICYLPSMFQVLSKWDHPVGTLRCKKIPEARNHEAFHIWK